MTDLTFLMKLYSINYADNNNLSAECMGIVLLKLKIYFFFLNGLIKIILYILVANPNNHIANLCKNAASQLNVLKRLSRSMGHMERKFIMQAFILSNFNYCALIWHFCSKSNTAKIEKIHERALRLVLDDHILLIGLPHSTC